MEGKDRIKSMLISISGYLILLLQQLPGIWIWAPLMAAPVFLLLGVLFVNIPARITDIFQALFSINEVVLGKFVIILGLTLTIYSIIFLGINKRRGFVKSGPYRFIRHPQYTGFILLTIGFTGWSYYYIKNTFGISWISAEHTIGLWYIEMILYFILAFVEEKHLTSFFGSEYTNYKRETPSFLPFLKIDLLNHIVSVIGFSLLFFLVIQFPFT
ncbi:MAG: methyltransferase family protein [Candidatus Hodarchaeales archaeon]